MTKAPAYDSPGQALVGTQVVYTARPDDDYIKNAVQAMRSGRRAPEVPVMICDVSGAARKLCESCAGAVAAAFGRGLVLINAEPHGDYLVADTSGNIKFKGRTWNQGLVAGASGSTGVNRVGFLVGSGVRFDGKSLESEERVVVLDIDKGGPVLEFSWKENSKTIGAGMMQLTAPKLALSPEGKQLAVLVGSTVRVYQVP
jgi:hypothetical protein